MTHSIPRIVIAGVSSGVGKTTATVALVAAFRALGLKTAVFKCGPDYLDPTYHARAAGVTSHNLDGWMMGREAVLATFERAAHDADIAIIEGVMGLFDGASPTSGEGSTAEIAKWLSAPVLLTVDASGMARTIAAVAKGFATFDPDVQLAGLICNRVGSKGHLDLLRKAMGKTPVVGGFPKKPECAFPERHLGLRTADSNVLPDSLIKQWAELAAEWFDLPTILALARSTPPLPTPIEPALIQQMERCRIGLAFDDAFHFYYEDNLRRLQTLGATLVKFSPVKDATLPDVDGLYFGGGYPELFARELSENTGMLNSIRTFAERGGPIYAECGGLMLLASGIRTLDGGHFPMAGLIPIETVMTPKIQALGYVEVETQEPTILGGAGLRFRGHQFRYSEPKALAENIEQVYTVRRRRGGDVQTEGYRTKNVLASYIHAHWASNPVVAEGFVDACAERRNAAR